MLSHLLIHLPPLLWKSQIALFIMPRLISGTNFLFHFVNQFHLFMFISTHPSLLHFLYSSPLHSFTLNSKHTFLVKPFRHRSLTINTLDWLPRLMGPFSVLTLLIGFSWRFFVQQTWTRFSVHHKIGNFISTGFYFILQPYGWIKWQ